MSLLLVLRYLAVAVICTGAISAHAATIWSETSNGDLSNSGLAPTPVTMMVGSNSVIGDTGNGGGGVDRDYFRFTVPPGAVLTAIKLLDNTAVAGGVSFIGIQPGAQVTVGTSGQGSENLIALGHYGNDQIGADLLPSIKIGSPGPLPSGTYSVWVQDTSGVASYGFDFVVMNSSVATNVPALPEWGMVVMATLLALLAWWCARRQRRA